MCNLFLSLRPTARHRLILLSVRDEYLQRPTAPAAWRDGVLSAIDLQDPLKGTWCGINEQGRVGVLLSITGPKRTNVPSRGRIVHDFLSSSLSGPEFCASLVPIAHEFNGFNFVALDRLSGGDYQMHSLTNALVDDVKPLAWSADVHVVGNCPPQATYGKMQHGKQLFTETVGNIGATSSNEEITTTDPRSFSSIFLRVGNPPVYGTRCQTAIIVSKGAHDSVFVREHRLLAIHGNGDEDWESNGFTFLVPATTIQH